MIDKKTSNLKKTKSKKTEADHKHTHQHAHPEIPSKLSWLPKRTFELEITIPWKMIAEEYQMSLKEMAKNVVIKGFRKGKAPLSLAEQEIGKDKIYNKVINHVVGHAYYDSVVKHNLRPVIDPKIEPKSMEQNKDWLVTAKSCEMPEVKLGDYKKIITDLKKTLIKSKKGKKEEKTQEINVEVILAKLTSTVDVEISQLLINEETDRILADVIDQVIKAGMTIEQYLKSRNLSAEKHREALEKQAEARLKQQFMLSEIAHEAKLSVSQEEIDKLIKVTSAQNPNIKQDANMTNYIKAMLLQQKTIDYLKNV